MRLVVVVFLLACAFLLGLSSRSSGASGLVRIFALQHGKLAVDLGRDGISAGDHTVSSYWLEDNPGHRIGHAVFICTALGKLLPDGIRACNVYLTLPRGRLTASGTRKSRDHYVLAITGGTGVYEGAGGTLLGSLYDKGPRRERLLISLV